MDLIKSNTKIIHNYKSHGEKTIGEFLENYGIPFEYEKPILVNDKGKPRIHYPDFYLSEYGSIIIEYFGRENDLEYNKSIEYKKDIYYKNYFDLISVYPKTFKKNWQEYLVKSIDDILNKRHLNFQTMVYQRHYNSPRKPLDNRLYKIY